MNQANDTYKSPIVPMERWGKDHWSTFAYIETCCVDNHGKLSCARMRPDANRHPLFVTHAQIKLPTQEYPTRLNDGELKNHDDWDCLWDMVRLGLIEILELGIGKIEGGIVQVRSEEIPEYFDIEPGKRGPIKTPEGGIGNSNGTYIRVKPTNKGLEIAAELRAHKVNGGSFANFMP